MYEQGLGIWLRTRRSKSAAAPCLVFDGVTTSYGELADASDRVAALLTRLGVRQGERVAFLGENSPAFLQVLFGAAQIGAVFVPVNTRLAPLEVAHVLQDCGAEVIVVDPALAEVLDRSGAQMSHRILTGAEDSDGDALARLLADVVLEDPVYAPVTLEDPAAIVYTSGTTGKPKGAVLTHGNLTWVAINTVIDYDLVSTDIALMISPLFHVASLGMGTLPVILKGGTIVLEAGFEAGRALALIERHGVTMLSGVPTTYQLMADHPDWARTDLSTLAKLTCGGSAVPTRVINAFEERGLGFSQGYGMTETSPGATSLDPSVTRSKQGSVGLPHFFTRVRVVDHAGHTVGSGTRGEIEIAGPNVFAGYHGQPEATGAAFSDDGWFRSGDIGYLDDDGYLYIADRKKDMVISGGENIYPAEIENLLCDMDGVTGAAVIGVPDDRWGEVPWAILTTRPGVEIDTERVRSFLDGRVARYKMPKNVVVVPELPRTGSGKVRKALLRAEHGPR